MLISGLVVLFLDFCFPLWALGECNGCVLPNRKFFWCHGICGHWASEYLKLILGSGDGLGGAGGGGEGVHQRKERRVCYQDLLSPLGVGADSEEGAQQVV